MNRVVESIVISALEKSAELLNQAEAERDIWKRKALEGGEKSAVDVRESERRNAIVVGERDQAVFDLKVARDDLKVARDDLNYTASLLEQKRFDIKLLKARVATGDADVESYAKTVDKLKADLTEIENSNERFRDISYDLARRGINSHDNGDGTFTYVIRCKREGSSTTVVGTDRADAMQALDEKTNKSYLTLAEIDAIQRIGRDEANRATTVSLDIIDRLCDEHRGLRRALATTARESEQHHADAERLRRERDHYRERLERCAQANIERSREPRLRRLDEYPSSGSQSNVGATDGPISNSPSTPSTPADVADRVPAPTSHKRLTLDEVNQLLRHIGLVHAASGSHVTVTAATAKKLCDDLRLHLLEAEARNRV